MCNALLHHHYHQSNTASAIALPPHLCRSPPPKGELVVIDVSQAVDLDHPKALDFLREDCAHVNDFFRCVEEGGACISWSRWPWRGGGGQVAFFLFLAEGYRGEVCFSFFSGGVRFLWGRKGVVLCCPESRGHPRNQQATLQ